MLEAASFILSNSNFEFDIYLFLQLAGTSMGTKFATSNACLSVGYLKETILFLGLSPLHFTLNKCNLIEEIFKRFMDDGRKSFVAKNEMLILMYLESFSMNYIPH